LAGFPSFKFWAIFFSPHTFLGFKHDKKLTTCTVYFLVHRKHTKAEKEDFFEMPGFVEQILNFVLLTGAPLVLLLDLLVLFFLTTHFQKKHPANWSLRLMGRFVGFCLKTYLLFHFF